MQIKNIWENSSVNSHNSDTGTECPSTYLHMQYELINQVLGKMKATHLISEWL